MTETESCDFRLSSHFTFHELSKTANAGLQEVNRRIALDFQTPLGHLAGLLELVRSFVSAPLIIHSGFRSPELNGQTQGSSPRSQHMKGEAADFSVMGRNADEAMFQACYENIAHELGQEKVNFGQFILEIAVRDYGVARWLHISLGHPWREKALCGQVLRMEETDGKPSWHLDAKVDYP